MMEAGQVSERCDESRTTPCSSRAYIFTSSISLVARRRRKQRARSARNTRVINPPSANRTVVWQRVGNRMFIWIGGAGSPRGRSVGLVPCRCGGESKQQMKISQITACAAHKLRGTRIPLHSNPQPRQQTCVHRHSRPVPAAQPRGDTVLCAPQDRRGRAGSLPVASTIVSRWPCLCRAMPLTGVLKPQLSSNPSQNPNAIELEGMVVAVLPGTMFRVQLANGHIVLGHISGKLRKHYIKIAAGDRVKMEMSPYDTDKARITFRLKETSSTYRPPPRRRY